LVFWSLGGWDVPAEGIVTTKTQRHKGGLTVLRGLARLVNCAAENEPIVKEQTLGTHAMIRPTIG